MPAKARSKVAREMPAALADGQNPSTHLAKLAACAGADEPKKAAAASNIKALELFSNCMVRT